MLNRLRKRLSARGFTLIELIVVMAVIAILVLLAAPKFLGYTQKAELTKIKNDTKVISTLTDEYLIQHGELTGAVITQDELMALATEEKLYDPTGSVTAAESIRPGEYTLLDNDFTKDSTLEGDFYANDLGDIYYVGTKAIGGGNASPSEEIIIIPEEALSPAMLSAMLDEELFTINQWYSPIEYTSESWAVLQSEIVNAENIINSGTATQQEYDDTMSALDSAKLQLVAKEWSELSVDKLQEHIAWTAMMQEEPAAYTPESWAVFQSSIVNAENIINPGTATQQEYDDAIAAIDTAHYQLVLN